MIYSLVLAGLAAFIFTPTVTFAAKPVTIIKIQPPQCTVVFQKVEIRNHFLNYAEKAQTPKPLRAMNESESSSLMWANWWTRSSSEKLIDVTTPSERLKGIAQFQIQNDGRLGLSVVRQVPIMVPSNTIAVFVDGYSVPREQSQPLNEQAVFKRVAL